MMKHLLNEPLILNKSRSFQSYSASNAYDVEETNLNITVNVIPINDLPIGCNLISSHVIYQANTHNDMSLQMKASIAPRENLYDILH